MENKQTITREELQRRRAARRRRKLVRYTIPRLLICVIIIGAVCILISCMSPKGTSYDETTADTEASAETQSPETQRPVTSDPTQSPIEMQAFYELTDAERELVEMVVSAESRGEPFTGQVAVAQCILNACLKHDIRPAEAIAKYHYTKNRAEPTESVKKAVAAVFDRGEGVTTEPILYFYNPAAVTSEFHESQIFVIEIQNHRFFKEAE